MGVLISEEAFEGPADIKLPAAIGRAWLRITGWVDSLIPQSEIRNPQSVAVFLDQPLIEGHKFDQEISRVAIVCGNCAGQDERPRRTLLIRDPLTQVGRCADCGGQSYELACRCYPRTRFRVRSSGFRVQG
ncbi:MAG: hypothetical protein AABN33_18220 [Acidobacteriota bacterium]